MYSPYNPIMGIGSPIPRKPVVFLCGGQDMSFYAPESLYAEYSPLFDKLNETGSMEACLSSMGRKDRPSAVLSEIMFRKD